MTDFYEKKHWKGWLYKVTHSSCINAYELLKTEKLCARHYNYSCGVQCNIENLAIILLVLLKYENMSRKCSLHADAFDRFEQEFFHLLCQNMFSWTHDCFLSVNTRHFFIGKNWHLKYLFGFDWTDRKDFTKINGAVPADQWCNPTRVFRKHASNAIECCKKCDSKGEAKLLIF